MLLIFSIFIFYYPNVLGHPINYIMVDILKTPPHIVPEWYFLPFYAILRSIPHKLGGVIAMFAALIVLLILPFINTSEVRSSIFRPIYKKLFWLLLADFLLLGWLGQQPVESPFIELGAFCTFVYFFFFICIIPLIGFFEKFLIKYK